MKSHRIRTKYNLTLELDGRWRLQIWTSATENMSPYIFVYQHKPEMPFEESQRDVFVNIAQPSDLTEYPIDTVGDVFPFFRKSYMDIVLDDSKLVEDTLKNINQDVRDLCDALDRIQ